MFAKTSAKGRARTILSGMTGTAAAVMLATGGASAQTAVILPRIVTPPSGAEASADIGRRVHTNVELFVPTRPFAGRAHPKNSPPYSGELFETPASLACAYGLVTVASGCNPNIVTTNPAGGSHAIAIVDAYNSPTERTDLAAFDAQFGLAAADFTVI
jgi:kumamolisin